MRVTAVIPFKGKGAKSRLSGIASLKQRRVLALSMLGDVISAVKSTPGVRDVLMVTSDPAAAERASARGVSVVRESSDSGVNSAVLSALRLLERPGAFVVLPSDLPLLEASDISNAIRFLEHGFQVVLSPSRSFNGTNMLLGTLQGMIPLSYDKDSFRNHIASCARRGLRLAVCCSRGLLFDLDSPSDLAELARSRKKTASAALARRLSP